MATSACPAEEDLVDYVRGHLSIPRRELLAAHIDRCEGCQKQIPGLTTCVGAKIDFPDGSPEVTDSGDRQRRERERLALALDRVQEALLDLDQQDREHVDAEKQPTSEPFPAQIGDYIIEEKIAHGGLGTVFRARQQRLNREVALKLLRSGQFATAEEKQRFQSEAQAAARLDHPNIVSIYEIGEDRGQAYLSMALIKGPSLASLLVEAPIPPKKAAQWMLQVTRAVAYAHWLGIIHRDLKPANILLDPSGRVFVTDFGLAKMLGQESGITHTGQIMGTPSFMPPEQAEGKAGQVGPASDIYSLGATLFCLIIGRPPFQSASVVETLKQICELEPISPRQINPAVDRDLDTICMKCLQKVPARRYPTAQALEEDLQRFVEGRPILARPITGAERMWRHVQRNPGLATLQVAIPLILVLGTAISLMFAQRASEQAALADEKTKLANSKTDEAIEFANRALERSYIAEQLNIRRAWEENRPNRVLQMLDRQRPEHTAGADLRGLEWYHWEKLARQYRRSLPMGDTIHDFALSPDGRNLVVVGQKKPIRMLDAVSGEMKWELTGSLLKTIDEIRGVAISPDGKQIVTGSADGMVRLWSLKTGEVRKTFSGHKGQVVSAAFHPAGHEMASGGADATVIVWDLQSGKQKVTFREHSGRVATLAYHPAGNRIASAGQDPLVRVWDPQTGKSLFTCDARTQRVHRVRFSPNGQFLGATGLSGITHLWDGRSGREIHSFPKVNRFTYGIAFSPDNLRLLDTSPAKGIRIFDVKSGELIEELHGGHTENTKAVAFFPEGIGLITAGDDETLRWWDGSDCSPRILTGHKLGITNMAASADGRWFASGGGGRILPPSAAPGPLGEILIWDARTETLKHHLKSQPGEVTRVAFCPRTGRLASGSGRWNDKIKRFTTGLVQFWDPVTGSPLFDIEGHTDCVSCLSFSPDGRKLVTGGMDGQVILWDVEAAKPLRTFMGMRGLIRDVDFHPTGGKIAARDSEKNIRIWNVETGTVLNQFPASGDPTGFSAGELRFSPDGSRLAYSGMDPHITIRECLSGEMVLEIKDTNYAPSYIEFTDDGRRILTAGDDAVVRFWDVQSGCELFTMRNPISGIPAAAFSSDRQKILIASWDKTISIWNFATSAANERRIR